MFRIWKDFEFSASHWLPNVPDGHPCKNLHGHNYIVTVELASRTLDSQGFVVDFNELDSVKRWIDAELDHGKKGILNDILPNPTSELLAKYIAENADWGDVPVNFMLYAVAVKETPKTGAVYYPDNLSPFSGHYTEAGE